ncbi:DUF6153 family protein [Prauserella alba]|uniref:Uncharacterized protein n=1 Tax=Prauserella alba TaxID=176898 RepID=A0ABP4FML6_9PSEU|nr:DUF6153 family protein [Prauserella alba]MCP2180385.1 hypothetical protein [Prauserella alba]
MECGRARWWLLTLLALPVLFGVVGMHALVTTPAPPAAATPAIANTTAGHDVSDDRGSDHSVSGRSVSDDSVALHSVRLHAGHGPRAESSHDARLQPGTEPHAGAASQGDTGPHADHDGLHQLLHLCLAILAAAGLVVLAAPLLTRLRPATAARRPPQPGGRLPVQRPPPTSRRLAQLCVMRT